MARRKLRPKGFAALNRATVGVRYPPGGGPAELRGLGKRKRRQKDTDQQAEEPTCAPARGEGLKALGAQNPRKCRTRGFQVLESFRIPCDCSGPDPVLQDPSIFGARPLLER